MTMKWYTQILSSVALFFGLSQESTEAEVHEKVSEYQGKTLDEVVNAKMEEHAQELNDKLQLAEAERDAALKEKEQASSDLEKANAEKEELEKEIEEQNQKIQELEARVAELEEEPAGDHSAGKRETQEQGKDKPWMTSSVNKRAMATYDKLKSE